MYFATIEKLNEKNKIMEMCQKDMEICLKHPALAHLG